MRWVQGGEAGQQASSGQNKAVRRLSNGEMRAEMRGWSGKMALRDFAQKTFHCTVVHGPKLALRGVTSHLVTDMCMYSHAIVGVSPHDYGRAMVGYICPTHTVSVTYKLGVTAAG